MAEGPIPDVVEREIALFEAALSTGIPVRIVDEWRTAVQRFNRLSADATAAWGPRAAAVKLYALAQRLSARGSAQE